MAVNFLSGVLGGTKGGTPALEPQRVNNALLHITDVPGLADEELVLALASFPIPKVNNGIIEVPFLNEKRKFAGNPTFDDLSVLFKDYVNKKVADALLQWRHQVYNPHTGAIGLKSVYGKQGHVDMFAPNGEGNAAAGIEPIRRYDLIGVWPSTYDPGDIDMAGEDALQITVTLTIDKAIPSDGFAAGRANTPGAAGGTRATAQGAPTGER